ncbi:Acid phosphatase type 7 [Blomia tropicalis]|nr:Acid phosphatase type 7 [Blomia tropicalis]
MKYISILAVCLLALSVNAKNVHEQIHLALGTDETEMVVTWTTVHAISDACHVEFGLHHEKLTNTTKAATTHFKHDGANFYTHRSLLTGLKPATKYFYRVGSKHTGFSTVYAFKTLQKGGKFLPKFAIYGDLGYQNEQSIPYLKQDVEKEMYDVIFHVGDMAYDLHERHGEQGNDFMRSIEKVAARVPYMTCPGNHENHGNFTHYDARFSMISDRHAPQHNAPLAHRLNNHFHSMDVGPAHIVMFSTEFYTYTKYGWDQIARQYHWLEQDLKRAHSNRAERPWIIVMGHKPMYCLGKGDHECNQETTERPFTRRGIHMHKDTNSPLKYGLEDLFYKYGVDIQFYGHEHLYGRLLPLYNFTIMSGSKEAPYTDPKGPVHIVTGSAGNREIHSHFFPHPKSFVMDHHLDYGYTRLTFVDTHHIRLEQTSDDKHNVVIDKFDIIKKANNPQWLR